MSIETCHLMIKRVYIMRADANKYDMLIPVAAEKAFVLYKTFDGHSQINSWTPLKVIVLQEEEQTKKLQGDFPALTSNIPVFSEYASQVLNDILANNGEILPLDCGNKDAIYYAYNVTKVVDALDLEKSEIKYFKDSTKVMRIVHYAFKPEKLHNVYIFRLPQMPLMYVFVTDDFVDVVTRNKLTGFAFEQVWPDD